MVLLCTLAPRPTRPAATSLHTRADPTNQHVQVALEQLDHLLFQNALNLLLIAGEKGRGAAYSILVKVPCKFGLEHVELLAQVAVSLDDLLLLGTHLRHLLALSIKLYLVLRQDLLVGLYLTRVELARS